MRRLQAFAAAALLVETVFFAALSPLLPGFAEDLHLSKWQSGLLVSMYGLAVGALAIPAGVLTSRFGVKLMALTGLGLVVVTSVLFGIVDGYWALLLARFGQGAAGTLCWNGALAWLIAAAPRKRRGQLIGGAMSAAIAGALLGPVLGGLASHFGRATVFSAVAAAALALAAVVPLLPAPPPALRQPVRRLGRALGRADVRLGLWMLMLPALLFGTLSVLAPLQLDRVGLGVAGVAATFVVAGLAEALTSPLAGRWSDRHGRVAPLRFGLAASSAVCLSLPWIGERWTLAGVVAVSGIAFGVLWTPAMALLTDGWEAAGVEHALGFSLLNLGFSVGNVVGAAAGGALAGAASDQVSWGLLACLTVATLLALRPQATSSGLAAQAADR
jgi:predicted MFS family arabinose efflux permease